MIWWSIDPGRWSGLAVWRDEDLVSGELAGGPSDGPLREAHDRVVARVRELAGDHPPELVVVELPQVYGQRRTDAGDLVDLAVLVGRIEEVLRGSRVIEVRPAAWKGQTPKDVVGRRVEGALSSMEWGRLAPCPASRRHNLLDAIGIGLWRLGRRPPMA